MHGHPNSIGNIVYSGARSRFQSKPCMLSHHEREDTLLDASSSKSHFVYCKEKGCLQDWYEDHITQDWHSIYIHIPYFISIC